MKLLKSSAAILFIGVASIAQSFSMDFFSCCGSRPNIISPRNSQKELFHNQSPISEMITQNKEDQPLTQVGKIVSLQVSQDEAYITEHEQDKTFMMPLKDQSVSHAFNGDNEEIAKKLAEIYFKKPHLKGRPFSIGQNGRITFGM